MPALWEENAVSYRAFWDLHPERPQYFGGCGFIPLQSIATYCAWRRLEMQALFHDLRALDTAYLKFLDEKRKHEQAEQKREAERTRRRAGKHAGR